MDARSPLGLAEVRVMLVLCLLCLAARGNNTDKQDSCAEPYRQLNVQLDSTHKEILCRLPDPSWMKATNLCDPNTFTSYDRCRGNICNVSSSDYLNEDVTFICCESSGERQCKQLVAPSITNHKVPGLVRVGREEALYTIVTSKPRPPPSIIPEVTIFVEVASNSSSEPSNFLLINDTTVEVIPSSLNPLEIIVIHTFVVPTGVEEGATMRFHFLLPPNWSSNGGLIYTGIPVIRASLPDPPTATVPSTPDNSNGGEEGANVTSTCAVTAVTLAATLASGTIGVAIVTSVVTALATCACLSKRKKKKQSSSQSSDFTPSSVNAPTDLNLQPLSSSGTNSTVTTPGLTPQLETTGLLTGSAGGVAHDNTTTMVANHYRQNSSDSGLTTTPTEGDQLFPSSTGLTSSAGFGSSEQAFGHPGRGDGVRGGYGDPTHHIYSTIGDAPRSVVTGAPPTTEPPQMFQLYNSQGPDSVISHVLPAGSTSSLLSRGEMIRPPLPSDQPGYASHGSRMHLLPQEHSPRGCNVTNV